MNLAKGKDGRIGRQVHGFGFDAQVVPAEQGERRGNVYISTHSIEEDQAYYAKKAAQARALNAAKRVERVAKERADLIQFQENQKKAKAYQKLAAVDPMNERLKKHFAKQLGAPEYERTENSVRNGNQIVRHAADFSSSGGSPEVVMSPDGRRPIEWRADFRQHEVVGSMLTRDGQYGPAVTDYDRYINGLDVNQTDIVDVGGTMYGRLDGQSIGNGMGLDLSSYWDKFTTGLTSGIDKGITKIADSLPDQIAKELQQIISGGGDAHVDQATGQIIVTRQPSVMPASSGIPQWAVYTGLGLAGLGVLLIAVKAFKK